MCPRVESQPDRVILAGNHDIMCARQESNLRFILRRDVSYPLYDERIAFLNSTEIQPFGQLLGN